MSPGCSSCYAEVLVTGSGPRQLNRPGTWGPDGVRERTSVSTWKKPERWERLAVEGRLPDGKPNPDGHRPRVFCASLADVFEPRPELEPWRVELFGLIAATPSLDWLLLTKRPEEARDWLRAWYENDDVGGDLFGREWTTRDRPGWGVPPNVWVGASVENSRFTWRADVLREIPAAVRFLSCEPLVDSLFRDRATTPDTRQGPSAASAQSGVRDGTSARGRTPLDLTGLDWIIVGAESGGRGSRPMHPAWAREIRDAVWTQSGLPPLVDPENLPPGTVLLGEPLELSAEMILPPRPALFFKQWGSWTPDEFGRDPNAVWVSPDGRSRSRLAADAYDDLPNGSMRMRYAGPYPHSGGKHLDDREWAEFPSRHLAPAPVGGGTK